MGTTGKTATKWLILYSEYKTNPSRYEEQIQYVNSVEECKKFLETNPNYVLKGCWEITGKTLQFKRELKETNV